MVMVIIQYTSIFVLSTAKQQATNSATYKHITKDNKQNTSVNVKQKTKQVPTKI